MMQGIKIIKKESNAMKKSKSPGKVILIVLLSLLAVVVVAVGIFAAVYAGRFQTISTIEPVTNYDGGFNLYRMNIEYDYSLDDIIDYGITDTQAFIDAVLAEALPLLPVKIKAPEFSCSAFGIQTDDGDNLMGRNYDFRYDTSVMLVSCAPENGYKSVAFAALDNINVSEADAGIKSKLACLTAPFICLDGMNEKGVSIAVLTLDSEPTAQDTDKPNISTTLAIRLVLDRAASTQEAVDLLKQYDMIASSGRDYHFYINDASGDGRVVEWDCHSETREMVVTSVRTVTNFFAMYTDKVTQSGKNGIYGHGKERYDKIEAVFEDADGRFDEDTAWQALVAASQAPSEEGLTSNTQWSIVFNNTDKTLSFVFRRKWGDTVSYDLASNTLTLQRSEK